MGHHDEADGYDGVVTLTVEGAAPRTAHAALAARFDPLAGHVVWSGRIDVRLEPRTSFAVTTPHGTGQAQAAETDPWGNTRLTGSGRPPFPVELLDG